MSKNKSFELLDGDTRVWDEQDAIHIKAIEFPSTDPVKLTPAMARKLAQNLRQLAEELEQ